MPFCTSPNTTFINGGITFNCDQNMKIIPATSGVCPGNYNNVNGFCVDPAETSSSSSSSSSSSTSTSTSTSTTTPFVPTTTLATTPLSSTTTPMKIPPPQPPSSYQYIIASLNTLVYRFKSSGQSLENIVSVLPQVWANPNNYMVNYPEMAQLSIYYKQLNSDMPTLQNDIIRVFVNNNTPPGMTPPPAAAGTPSATTTVSPANMSNGQGFFQGIGSNIQSGGQAVGGDIQAVAQTVGGDIQAVAQTVGGDIQSILQAVGGGLQNGAQTIGGDIQSLGQNGYSSNQRFNQPIQQRDNYYTPYPIQQQVDPFSYNGALPSKGTSNYMPVTADFSKFSR